MKNKVYKPFNTFVVRTPLFPLNYVQNHPEIIEDIKFKEALFLASPDLSKRTDIETKDKDKLDITLRKYSSRSSTRCTPFGLFAGCSTGIIHQESGVKSDIELVPSKEYRRCTRLDMQYLCALIEHIEKDDTIRPFLLFYPNDSIYDMGNKLRYVEYNHVEKIRIHQISSVESSTYLLTILDRAKQGATVDVLAKSIIDEQVGIEDATDFVNELIDSQLLKSELAPSIVGDDILTVLIKKISVINSNYIILKSLHEIKKGLTEIDCLPIGSPIELYDKVIDIIEKIGVNYDVKYLFQTDMFKPVKHSYISQNIVNDISDALSFLSKLNSPYKNPTLEAFKNAFINRFEEQQVPLTLALDGELGLGYPISANSGGLNILIDNLFLPEPSHHEREATYNSIDILILKKYIDAIKNNEAKITITDSDFSFGDDHSTENLPETISVLCNIISDTHSERKTHIKTTGGNSGALLLGRFCHIDNEILNLVHEIVEYEKEAAKDVIIAELSHLPASRYGNIISRPIFRDYILHYLSNCDEDSHRKIEIGDLMLSVKNNKLQLFSKKLNKQIIPRLTCAHNPLTSSIPIYRFLADMQSGSIRHGLNLPLGDLFSVFEYMPRIEYKNVILKRQRWTILNEEIKDCYLMNDIRLLNFIDKFILKRKLTRYVVIVDSDNEMYIDLKDIDCLKIMLSISKKKPSFILEEFLSNKETSIVKNGDDSYTNETIFFFHK